MNSWWITNSRFLYLAALILAVVGAFQNCSPAKFSSPGVKTENNGAGYGGKPTGEFYRFVPDFTCEQSEAPAAHISINGSQVTLIENRLLLCKAVNLPLTSAQIDNSVFQGDIVGYLEGIFEVKELMPTSIPANLVEVWCRDRKDAAGIETITHYDRNLNLAMNRTFYSTAGVTQQIPDFPVSRLIADRTVTVRDANGFELIVHRDQPAPEVGLFNGELTTTIDGRSVRRSTFCRLGGSLDPKVWPARQIVDFAVQKVKASPDMNHLAYSSPTATGIPNLYVTKMDGTSQLRVSPKLLLAGINDGFDMNMNFMYSTGNFLFTPDSRSLIYNGDVNIPDKMELFQVNVDGTNHRQIDGGLTTDGIGGNFQLLDDGNTVIFRRSWFGMITYLTSVTLTDLAPKVFQAPVSHTHQSNSNNFDFSRTKNKVAFLCCVYKTFTDPAATDFYVHLYAANPDGSGVTEITPPMPSADWALQVNPSVVIPNGLDYALVEAMEINGNGKQVFAVAVDGSGSIALPQNMMFNFASPSGSAFLIGDYNSEGRTNLKLFRPATNTIVSLPRMKIYTDGDTVSSSGEVQSTFFSTDSQAFIGPEILANGSLRAISVNTSTGAVQDFCPGAVGEQMLIKEIRPDAFAIVTFSLSAKIVSVYRRNITGPCALVNSAPSTNPEAIGIHDVLLSPDGEKVLVNLGAPQFQSLGYFASSQLFYIPLNGLPSYLVSTPVFNAATVSRAHFLNDSKTVIYVGDQIRSGELNVFRWTAP